MLQIPTALCQGAHTWRRILFPEAAGPWDVHSLVAHFPAHQLMEIPEKSPKFDLETGLGAEFSTSPLAEGAALS